jgi:hypothetical protein
MNITRFAITALVAAVLAGGASARAVTTPFVQTTGGTVAVAGDFQVVDFGHRPEADMLRRAYAILATGDHDYKGHRVAAMREVKKAAELLGFDLGGDDKNKERQRLSDDKMREARDLLDHVLGAAEVKDQEKIAKHISKAIREIDGALAVR